MTTFLLIYNFKNEKQREKSRENFGKNPLENLRGKSKRKSGVVLWYIIDTFLEAFYEGNQTGISNLRYGWNNRFHCGRYHR